METAIKHVLSIYVPRLTTKYQKHIVHKQITKEAFKKSRCFSFLREIFLLLSKNYLYKSILLQLVKTLTISVLESWVIPGPLSLKASKNYSF